MTARQKRAFTELKDLEPEDSPEVILEKLNETITFLNFLSKNLSLQSNFNGQVVTVEIAASTNKRIYHNLGIPPKYRLILRQEGNGLLTDVPLEWNDKYITIRNNGAVTVEATIALLKE